MSRIKLTEYRAKKLLLGESYRGVQVRTEKLTEFSKSERLVVKVDQGVKQRMKKGLVLLEKSPRAMNLAMSRWRKKGFSQFLIEPLVHHKQGMERYFSLERVREGVRFVYSREGGVDIESHPEAVETYILKNDKDIRAAAQKTEIPENFLARAIDVFRKNFFVFFEINPLVIVGGTAYPLDAAVLADSAGSFFVNGAWTEDDVIAKTRINLSEKRIDELAKTSPASFKLTVLNPNGSLFFLLSGGGGSIVIADEAELNGVGGGICNYGEYSGGPTRQETYLYAKEIINLLLKSKAKRKALVIAGGVANFTDVKQTFSGIIDALAEASIQLRKSGVKVFVRRGGPNERAGLLMMSTFLKKEKILGAIYGSDSVITRAVDDAISFIKR